VRQIVVATVYGMSQRRGQRSALADVNPFAWNVFALADAPLVR
jgi:hypothetical protein